MAVQEVTIKVDVPDGWDVVDFRVPLHGEMFVSANGSILESIPTGICPDQPRLVLRRVTPWPSWLKAAAYAKDSDGRWWAYMDVPANTDDDHWSSAGGGCWNLKPEFCHIPDPDVPWQDSLRINPAYKGADGK